MCIYLRYNRVEKINFVNIANVLLTKQIDHKELLKIQDSIRIKIKTNIPTNRFLHDRIALSYKDMVFSVDTIESNSTCMVMTMNHDQYANNQPLLYRSNDTFHNHHQYTFDSNRYNVHSNIYLDCDMMNHKVLILFKLKKIDFLCL